jgi:hypothetical protein
MCVRNGFVEFLLCMILQWFLSQTIQNFDDVKFEAASLLSSLYEEQNQYSLAKPILRKAVELSNASVYWHSRLIFQLSVSDEHLNDNKLTTWELV